jgi:DUF4097 and DUF4098 domain-containing protein YvlB
MSSHFVVRASGLALLTFALGTAAASAETLTEPFAQSYPLAAGGKVSVSNTNGAVTIDAWDQAQVKVEAVKKVKAGSAERAREILKELKVQVDARPDSVRIETKVPQRSNGFWAWISGSGIQAEVEYHIHVPRRAAVTAENTNGGVHLTGTQGAASLETTNGGVTVDRVAGDVRLHSTNGALHATGVSGAVEAETTNGGIDIQLASLPAGRSNSLESTNGAISVHLPKDARLSLDAATTNGGVSSDFELTGGSKGKHSLSGAINGGGGKMSIRTTNGGIHVAKQ